MRKALLFIMSILYWAELHSVTPPTEKTFISCVQQIESQFVLPQVMAEGMAINRVQQTQWTPIIDNYRRRLRGLTATVKQEAGRGADNPLSPFDAKRAGALLRRILLSRLTLALNESNYYNQAGADALLNYMIERQPQHIIECIEGPAQQAGPPVSAPTPGTTPQQGEEAAPVMPIEPAAPWQPTPPATPRWR